jgi:hypothetical protein
MDFIKKMSKLSSISDIYSFSFQVQTSFNIQSIHGYPT